MIKTGPVEPLDLTSFLTGNTRDRKTCQVTPQGCSPQAINCRKLSGINDSVPSTNKSKEGKEGKLWS